MGLASSSYRYQFLEWRNDDISLQLAHLSNDKQQMASDSLKLSKRYTEALNSKRLKLSFNNGATYIDMSYSNLTSPNVANSNKPMFITNADEKVVIAGNYLKYAQMISADGSINEEGWESIRTQVLTELVGITAEELQAYDDGTSTENILTAEQKSLIQFYDLTFKTIANNGWTYNPQVTDNDYLNDSLQNGFLYLTTYNVEKQDDGGYKISYNTDYATNNSNVYSVNDSTEIEEAKAEYDAGKEKINRKETIIDTRMQALETEYESNKNIMESIKNVMEENIERTMNVFA